MVTRVPLFVAVAGALLIGGAGAGGTHATWSSQRQLSGAAVSSGALGFTASQPTGVTVARTAGAAATTSLVLDDTSVGKNLTQRITTQVGTTPTGITATVGTSCPGAPSVQVNTSPTSADVTLCVRVVSSTSAVSGNVVLNVSGAQTPSGWTTPTTTVSVPVTAGSAPVAPVPTCASDDRSFSWTVVPGATQYVVGSSTNQGSGYLDVSTQTTTSYAPSLSGQSTTYFRVWATNSTGDSPASKIIRMVRSGSNYTCTVLP